MGLRGDGGETGAGGDAGGITSAAEREPSAGVCSIPPAPSMAEVLERVAAYQAARAPGGRPLDPVDLVSAATAGWRGATNRLSGGVLKLRPSAAEVRHRRDRVTVLRSFESTQTIVVANPKGGAGKTPMTLLLAATFGAHRGGYTLAWDNNETMGTLGSRAEAGTNTAAGNVIGLLGEIDSFLSTRASVGSLGRFVRPQSAHFDVLASDDMPGRMETVDGRAFDQLRDVLGKFYRIMVIDTGNNVRAPNWWAAVRSASCLVIPTTVQADAANTGLWMVDHLHRLGRSDLVHNAVVAVTCGDPRPSPALLNKIVEHYRGVVRDVVVIPFDRAVQPGLPIAHRSLAEPTRRAALSAAVAVVESMSGEPAARSGGGTK